MFLAISGCAATGTDAAYLASHSNTLSSEYAVKFADEQIRLSQQQSDLTVTEHYLLSAQALLNANLPEQAEHLLKLSMALEPSPNTDINSWRSLLEAQLYWQQHKCEKAQAALRSLSAKTLGPATTALYYELLSDLHRCQGKISLSINDQLKGISKQSEPPSDTVLLTLWESLQSVDAIPESSLKKTPALAPWYSLLTIARRTDDISTDISAWKSRWHSHPAQMLTQGEPRSFNPKQIAILLPDSGPYMDSAEYIKDGLLAAYYAHPNRASLQLRFYDTEAVDSVKAYQQAVGSGADVVIGPLVKNDLIHLAKAKPKDFPTPVIALNTSERAQAHPHLFQLSLSPEDELYYLAKQMVADSYMKVGVLYPNTDYGNRLMTSFQEYWTQEGGKLSSVAYDSNNDQAVYVRQLLDIDASQSRAKIVRQLTLRKTHSVPRRRQDIDAIVLISDEASARQIRPLLDFYYAESLPVYATSSVYSGMPDAKRDRDLNDIRFCDLPWLLNKQHPQRSFLDNYLSIYDAANSQQIRLFAMGLDAFSLALNVPRLEQYPSLGYPGTTGVLRVTENNRILRQPSWARFKNGLPVLINNS
jgi:hypothetical protein